MPRLPAALHDAGAEDAPGAFQNILTLFALSLVLHFAACVQEPEGILYTPTPPTVIHTAPAHLETGVALDRVVTATFSRPMDPNTINVQNFIVVRATGMGSDTVAGTVSYSPGDSTATFTPNDSLLYCQLYSVFITGATDFLCNALADTTWTFTTPAPVPQQPVVTHTSPAHLEDNVALDAVITATFNVPMNPNSINTQNFIVVQATGMGPDTVAGTVSYSPGNSTATFTPDDSLMPGQLYMVFLTATTLDSVCLALEVDTTWTFTTPSLPPPPVLEAINNGSSFSLTAHANPILELYWFPSAGAATYHLQIASDPLFTTIVHDQPGIPHVPGIVRGDVPITDIPPGAYYWRVNATGSNGTSNWSAVWSFTTTP